MSSISQEHALFADGGSPPAKGPQSFMTERLVQIQAVYRAQLKMSKDLSQRLDVMASQSVTMQGVLVQALKKLGSKRQRVDPPPQRESPFTASGTASGLARNTSTAVDIVPLPSSASSIHVGGSQQLTATSSGCLSYGAAWAAAASDASDGGCGTAAASDAAATGAGLLCTPPANQTWQQQQQQEEAPYASWTTGICGAPVQRQLSSAACGAGITGGAAAMGVQHSSPVLPTAPAAGSGSPMNSPSPQMPASRCNSGCTSAAAKPVGLAPLHPHPQQQPQPVLYGPGASIGDARLLPPMATPARTVSSLPGLPILSPMSAAGALGPSGGSGYALETFPDICGVGMNGIPIVANITNPLKREAERQLWEPEPPAAALVQPPLQMQMQVLHRQRSQSMQQQPAPLAPVAAAATGESSSTLALSLAAAATAEMQRQLEATQQENERLMRQQQLHQQQLLVLREQQRQRSAVAAMRNSSHGGQKQQGKKDGRGSGSSVASSSKGGKGRAALGAQQMQQQQQQQGVGLRGTITAMHDPRTFGPAYFSNPHVLMQLQMQQQLQQQQQPSAFAGSCRGGALQDVAGASHPSHSASSMQLPAAGAAVASPASRFASGDLNRTSSRGMGTGPALGLDACAPAGAVATNAPTMAPLVPPAGMPAAGMPAGPASPEAAGGMQCTPMAAAPAITSAAAAELQQTTAAASLRHLQQLQQQIAELQQQIAQQAAAHLQQQPQQAQHQPQQLQAQPQQAQPQQMQPQQAQYAPAQQQQQQVPNGAWGHCFVMDEAVEADAAAEVLGLGLFMDV